MKQRRFYPVLLLFAVLLITAVFSCKQGSSPVKGSKVNHDSAFARYSIAQKLFNNNQHDSLLKVAPEILDFLRENQEWELYYILWQSVAEDHVWFNEFEEATQEAQAMQGSVGKEEAPEEKEKYRARMQRFREIPEDKGGLLRAFILKEYRSNRYKD
jgi:hypothetical protein